MPKKKKVPKKRKKRINSRAKGSAGEREAAAEFNRLLGTKLRRSQQFCGASDESDDLIGVDGLSVEVKRVQNLNLHKAINKTEEDAKEGTIPIVLHRKNNQRWLATVYLDDLPDLGWILDSIINQPPEK